MPNSRLVLLFGLACSSALFALGGCGSDVGSAQPGAAGARADSGAANLAGSSAAGAPTGAAGALSAGYGGTFGASGSASASGASAESEGGNAGSSGALGGTGGALSGSSGSAGSAGAAAAGTAGSPNPGYSACPAAPNPCVILPFGDSITYGYGSSDAGGYRSQLFALAVADNQSLTFVGSSADGPSMVSGKAFPRSHEGHPGYTITGSKGIAQYVDQGIIKQFKPNIVLLMIGTNDISQNLDLPNAPQRLGKLIDSIFADAPNALIVVAKITPSQKEPANTNTTSYNAALPAIIKTRADQGKHITLVDMNAPFLANGNWKKALMTDSVHPNDAGYAILGKTWYVALRDALR